MRRSRYGIAYMILIVLVLIFLAVNICAGSINIPIQEVWNILSGRHADAVYSDIVDRKSVV